MLRIDKELPLFMKSISDKELPRSDVPYKDNDDAQRVNARNEYPLLTEILSRVDRALPSFTIPYIDNELPSLEKDRNESNEPSTQRLIH
jgi:hypothetical protein